MTDISGDFLSKNMWFGVKKDRNCMPSIKLLPLLVKNNIEHFLKMKIPFFLRLLRAKKPTEVNDLLLCTSPIVLFT